MDKFQEQLKSAPILIVDDNRTNVALLETMLAASGFSNVMAVLDARQVAGLHAQHDFDLILLDFRMPYMDGLAVLEALRKVDPSDYLPVIMLTAELERTTRLTALSSGAKDFLTKPFDPTEVVRRAENVLTARVLLRERAREALRLEEAVQKRTRELEESQLEIVRSLGRAGEYRDNETGMHVLRMSRYCELLAKAAGLGDAFAKQLLEASPMHDVGKIGIPDSILLKPGKLEPREFEIMKSHAAIGAEIIQNCGTPLLEMARTVARCHHEKWDGTGYPAGLKGEDIPIEARVVAICDVFDALTSHRPYKRAWPVEEAVALLQRDAGKHFDPKLVPVFLSILPAVLEVKNTFPDPEEEQQPAALAQA